MSNYDAYVAEIKELQPIEGSDFIQHANVLGEWVIVNKKMKVGDRGILFVVGSQVSFTIAHALNLHRNTKLNKDSTQQGFLEDNRRIIALKLRGARSEGLFIPIEGFSGVVKNNADTSVVDPLTNSDGDLMTMPIGSHFASHNNIPFSRRYNTPVCIKNSNSATGKKAKKMSVSFFAEHQDTAQFKTTVSAIPEGAILYFHSKRHGTSSRVGRLPVTKELPLWKQWVNKIYNVFNSTEYATVIGTRRTIVGALENNDIKDASSSFYKTHQFRIDVAKKLAPHLTDGITVYGEILGFVGGETYIMASHDMKPLGKEYVKKYGETVNYRYGCLDGQHRHIVYRITYTDENGNVIEFSQNQLENWCKKRDLEYTLEVHPPIVYDGDVDSLMKLVEQLTERNDVLTECYDTPSQISEGIIIRAESPQGVKFFKSKSFAHRVCEGHEVEASLEELS